MTKVLVSFEFDTMQEAAKFFGDLSHPTQAGPAVLSATRSTTGVTPPVAAPAEPAPIDAPSVVQVMPMTTSAPMAASVSSIPTASPESNVDFGLAARTALSELVARFDAVTPGSGAQKAKEILTKHGLTRVRDVTAAQAPALIADFKSAA